MTDVREFVGEGVFARHVVPPQVAGPYEQCVGGLLRMQLGCHCVHLKLKSKARGLPKLAISVSTLDVDQLHFFRSIERLPRS